MRPGHFFGVGFLIVAVICIAITFASCGVTVQQGSGSGSNDQATANLQATIISQNATIAAQNARQNQVPAQGQPVAQAPVVQQPPVAPPQSAAPVPGSGIQQASSGRTAGGGDPATVNGMTRRMSGVAGTIPFKSGEAVMGITIRYADGTVDTAHPYCPVTAGQDGTVFDGAVNPWKEETRCS